MPGFARLAVNVQTLIDAYLVNFVPRFNRLVDKSSYKPHTAQQRLRPAPLKDLVKEQRMSIFDRNDGVISEADQRDLETVLTWLHFREIKQARWLGLIEPETVENNNF